MDYDPPKKKVILKVTCNEELNDDFGCALDFHPEGQMNVKYDFLNGKHYF